MLIAVLIVWIEAVETAKAALEELVFYIRGGDPRQSAPG